MTTAGHSLERRAISLGTAYAVDYGLQFLLPVVLTRALDPHSFGEYRLLWLAVSTLLVIAPMCMPQSLYYFMPRSDANGKRLYLNQCAIFMVLAGFVSAWILSPLNPWLPMSMQAVIADNGWLVPAFTMLWVFAWLLDILPTVDERVSWQARVIVALSALRAIGLSAVALATRDLKAVLIAMLVFVAIKSALLVYYIARHHGLRGPWMEPEAYKAQLRQAAPFALSGALHGLRAQGDQWIAAALFTVTQFASFSIATVLAPAIQMLRQSVNHVFLPSMSRMESSGDVRSMLALNGRANSMVALMAYPILAFAFVFAEPLISLIYTPTYVDAVPVLRLYSIGLIALVVEINSVLFLLKQGAFAARVNALVLALALPLSYFGATTWGLTGAALGSVVALYSERAISLSRIAKLSSVPVSELQDWPTLAGILGAACIAALVADVSLMRAHFAPFLTLACGAALVAVTYPAALFLTGQRRSLTSFISSLGIAHG